MSGKKAQEKTPDRRVRRTYDALIAALIDLIVDKGFDKTTVQDILDRANVSRSTFYSHFANKDDLLVGQWTLFQLESDESADAGALPLPSTAHIFRHVGEQLPLYQSLKQSGTLGMVLQVAREDMDQSLERIFSQHRDAGHHLPEEPAFLSRFIAGAFISLMTYWLESGMRESPDGMDERFRRLADLNRSEPCP